MATTRKRGDKWQAEVRLNGRYAAKTFRTKREALKWAVEKEDEFAIYGRDLVLGKTVRDAYARYAADVSPTKKGARWEIVRLGKLARQPLADIQLAQLHQQDIVDWVNQSGQTLSAGSVRREFMLLSTVMAAARKWNWIHATPCKGVALPPEPPPRDRRISELEMSKLLSALNHRDDAPETPRQELAIAFLLAIETALRAGEIWELTWDRVRLKQRYLTLKETKNGTARNVPLSKAAVRLLEILPHEGDLVFTRSKTAAGAMFRRVCRECNIEDLHFHDTRHEALTRLARKLDVLDLARMVGHKDPRSLMIYYNATASEIAERLD